MLRHASALLQRDFDSVAEALHLEVGSWLVLGQAPHASRTGPLPRIAVRNGGKGTRPMPGRAPGVHWHHGIMTLPDCLFVEQLATLPLHATFACCLTLSTCLSYALLPAACPSTAAAEASPASKNQSVGLQQAAAGTVAQTPSGPGQRRRQQDQEEEQEHIQTRGFKRAQHVFGCSSSASDTLSGVAAGAGTAVGGSGAEKTRSSKRPRHAGANTGSGSGQQGQVGGTASTWACHAWCKVLQTSCGGVARTSMRI